jgi:4-hydroxy-2-oxoheptanedioate aldolase
MPIYFSPAHGGVPKMDKLRSKLANGTACINGWSLNPSTVGIEAYCQAGWDTMTLDMQHGWWDYAAAISALMAIKGADLIPLVRVPSNDASILGKFLDAGAEGIICPMVNTAAEAESLVLGCFYPPSGQRSFGPIRGDLMSQTPLDLAPKEVIVLPQIETRIAVTNIDEILDVEGISGVYVGPADLGLSMELPAILDRGEPEVLLIYETILRATKKRGKIASIHTGSASYAIKMIAMGFNFVTVGSDIAHMLGGAASSLGEIDSSVSRRRVSGY